MYVTLSDVICRLNSNILCFSVGITVPQESSIQANKSHHYVIPLSNTDSFFNSKIIPVFFVWDYQENYLFSNFRIRINSWNISWAYLFFFNVQNINSNCQIIFSQTFCNHLFLMNDLFFSLTFIYKRFNI